MTSGTPARDFLEPGLRALIAQADEHGITRDVAIAVLIDLVTGPGFNDTPLDPAEDVPATNTGTMPIGVEETAIAAGQNVPVDDLGGGLYSGGQPRHFVRPLRE